VVYTAGADLLFVAALMTEIAAGIRYTPLLALPVLMAAILARARWRWARRRWRRC
jgi:hypothetical protein